MALRAYGNWLFCNGGSLYSLRHTLLAAQRKYLNLRPVSRVVWELITRWEHAEPPQHRTPIPEPILKAVVTLAWLQGFRCFAASTLLAFYGLGRIGEAASKLGESIPTQGNPVEGLHNLAKASVHELLRAGIPLAAALLTITRSPGSKLSAAQEEKLAELLPPPAIDAIKDRMPTRRGAGGALLICFLRRSHSGRSDGRRAATHRGLLGEAPGGLRILGSFAGGNIRRSTHFPARVAERVKVQ
eukprot:s5693_g5.t1